MELMERGKVYKGLIGAFGACLLLAGCSSSQKPAALGPVGESATDSAAGSATVSATPTGTAASSSSSTGSASGSSPAAAAPRTVITSSAGLTYKATVPGDPDSAAALTAFENYRVILTAMSSKPDYSTNLGDYADGNPLTLADTYILTLKQNNEVMVGTTTETVTSSTLTMAASPLPLMTITVCKDATKYHEVFSYGKNKGKLAVSDITHPYPLTYTVHKSADGKWRVTSVHGESDKTC
ncbi:hypothetical protein Caci_8211 [Catenulispora acidiphila DSM 44928]|uniref:Lipoprotein n=2 Tax=Catenulispora TaxID=414878 RepID=C7QIY4_CATAD|nr:hypothetical protein Caci_8211 [Catenulispora acidiphila DSM 44928]